MTASRTVVITGGSAGVGRASAIAFARAGYSVAVLARGEERLAATRRQVEALGRRCLSISCDVSDAGAVERAAIAVEEGLGPIDVWVNNAMLTVFGCVDDLRPEEFRRITEVTYLGVVHGTMAALTQMRPRNRGTIIQVGSALSHRSIPLQSAYCGSKHAIVGFSASLRSELSHQASAIHVGMVQLPAMNTPQFSWARSRLPGSPLPGKPIYQPEIAAEMVVWAATHRRRQVLVGWPTVALVTLNKVMPGSLDRYLGRIAYDAQHTSEPADPQRVDNLMAPAPGLQGAHGPFDDRAKTRSVETVMSRHRPAITAAGVTVLPLALWARRTWLRH